jgi:hypothetical protein
MPKPHFSTPLSVLIVSFLLLPACDGDSAFDPRTDGQLRFRYTGAVAGEFLAIGPAANALNSRLSFAAAFHSAAGELQLCAYQPTAEGDGRFVLINVGRVIAPGTYSVPPGWAEGATSYQPGTFLFDVDASRTGVGQIFTFVQGTVTLETIASERLAGTFAVSTGGTELTGGSFDVPVTTLEELPVICQ